jgi:hypothetical protein
MNITWHWYFVAGAILAIICLFGMGLKSLVNKEYEVEIGVIVAGLTMIFLWPIGAIMLLQMIGKRAKRQKVDESKPD